MATLMLEGGANIRFIQEMLGHARLDTTHLHACDDPQAEANPRGDTSGGEARLAEAEITSNKNNDERLKAALLETLSLCTRPVRFFKLLGDLGACHGFLKLSDGTTIGGYNRNGQLVPNDDDYDDKKDPNHLKETKCTEVSKCPDVDDNVRDAYYDLKEQFDQYRDATGRYPTYRATLA